MLDDGFFWGVFLVIAGIILSVVTNDELWEDDEDEDED